MTALDFQSIVSEINGRAITHVVGQLAAIRKELKGKTKLPRDIFPSQTVFDTYAFHFGGRRELQFNICLDGVNQLRYGVAFSLETNQSLPSIDVLVPKIRLFNDFIELYSEEYGDMRMWHSVDEHPSTEYVPSPISPAVVIEGAFIFLGKRQKLDQLDYESILTDLDRLVPLYRYVESSGTVQPLLATGKAQFKFRPGFGSKAPTAKLTLAERQLNITLRHNVLQEALCRRLARKYGAGNVGDEQPNGAGTKIDVVVRRGGHFWFYEIKTADSPRACLRQAVGQLLEYAFWPGAKKATRLVVVGERTLDKEGQEYLEILQKRFGLPITYEHVAVRG